MEVLIRTETVVVLFGPDMVLTRCREDFQSLIVCAHAPLWGVGSRTWAKPQFARILTGQWYENLWDFVQISVRGPGTEDESSVGTFSIAKAHMPKMSATPRRALGTPSEINPIRQKRGSRGRGSNHFSPSGPPSRRSELKL